MGVQVRLAQDWDVADCLGIYLPLANQTRVPLTLDDLKRYFQSRRAFLVAYEGESILGFLCAALGSEQEVEIHYLAVRMEAQGKGAGRRLFEALRLMAPTAKIFLEVAEDNLQALGFYEKMGAKKLYFRKNYYNEVGAWVLEALPS